MGHFLYISPFQSTLPVWGGTEQLDEDLEALEFQSTLPVWGGTLGHCGPGRVKGFQSTLPVWGGTWPVAT